MFDGAADDTHTDIEQIFWRMGTLTYILKADPGFDCYVRGDDPEYYASLECEEMDWDGSSYYD